MTVNKWIEFRSDAYGAKNGRVVLEEEGKLGVFIQTRSKAGNPGKLIWIEKNSKDYKFIDSIDVQTATNRVLR